MEELNLNKKNGEILSSGEWNRIISALNSIIRQYNNMPDKVSDFENDLGYLTELDLLGLASESFVGNAILDLIDSGVMAGPKGEDGANGLTPFINQANKHWMIGDTDTGIVAEGQNGLDGLSPSITITEITGGHRVVITDANDSYTFDVMNGNDGLDGITPHIDSSTKHWMIGEIDTGIVAEGLNGLNGTNGTNGLDGVTPHIDSITGNWFIGNTDTGVHALGPSGTSLSNETATQGGSILSAVTTGDKYNWNNKASIWSGTQVQYDALNSYDSNTIYIITASS